MFSISDNIFNDLNVPRLAVKHKQEECSFGALSAVYTFGADLFDASLDCFGNLAPSRIFLVHDAAVSSQAEAYASRWRQVSPVSSYAIKAAETEKTLDRMAHLMSWAITEGVDRKAVMVAMGGGLVGNIAGLAAHLLLRGITLVHFPTTYMAAFDSVLSQKQAVNANGTKNLVGAFQAPHAIFCDCRFFDALPSREIRAGLAESVKNALIAEPDQAEELLRLPGDPAQYGMDEHELVWRKSVMAKMPHIALDAKETGPALIFEYGHTVGHAIEASSKGALRHGEAVALGLRAAGAVSANQFGLDPCFLELHGTLLDHFGLNRHLPPDLSLTQLETLLRKDNKRGYIDTPKDHVAMVLAKAPGRAHMTGTQPLVPVPLAAVMEACAALAGE